MNFDFLMLSDYLFNLSHLLIFFNYFVYVRGSTARHIKGCYKCGIIYIDNYFEQIDGERQIIYIYNEQKWT